MKLTAREDNKLKLYRDTDVPLLAQLVYDSDS